jgi:5-methylcytosine-specific restriction endonuclease McrA
MIGHSRCNKCKGIEYKGFIINENGDLIYKGKVVYAHIDEVMDKSTCSHKFICARCGAHQL